MDANTRTVPTQEIALNPRTQTHERALLHALLQASDYGILLCGLDRQDVLANRRFGELFALPPHEIVQTDPDTVREIARTLVRNPEAFEELLRRTDADPILQAEDELELRDPPRILRRATSPVFDRDGTLLGRLWTFLDITETRKLQAEVRAQLEARTEDFRATSAVLRNTNDLCRLTAQPHRRKEILEEIAACIQALVGWEYAAVLLLTPDGTECRGVGRLAKSAVRSLCFARGTDAALDAALNTPFHHEPTLTLHHRKPGKLARALGSKTLGIVPLATADRTLGALAIGTRQNVSELEGPARYFAAHLGAIVDQVTLTLETHRLQSELHEAVEAVKAAQEQLVAAERLRTAGALAASVAHDIRNILTATQMELALHPDAAPLYAQLNRFSALTHRLLAFARSGVLESRPTSLSDVLHRVVTLLSGQAQISAVEMSIEIPDTLPAISADATRMEQLFVNLCLNAIQAMNERGGTLRLTARARDYWIEIQVQDTGGGIPPEIVPRLFDPFFTTRATGTGLGLFSSKRIVEEHGGQISVTGEPGQGACFTVLLPIAPTDRDADARHYQE